MRVIHPEPPRSAWRCPCRVDRKKFQKDAITDPHHAAMRAHVSGLSDRRRVDSRLFLKVGLALRQVGGADGDVIEPEHRENPFYGSARNDLSA